MAGLSFFISIFLRLQEEIFIKGWDQVMEERDLLFPSLPIFIVVCAAVFLSSDLYKGIWRFASLNDMTAIFKTTTIAVFIFTFLMFAITRLETIPRSLPFINWFVLIILLGGPRFIYRVFKDHQFKYVFSKDDQRLVPILLVGMGNKSELFIRELNRSSAPNYKIIGIIGKSKSNIGQKIHNVEVIDQISNLNNLLEKLKSENECPQRIVMATENLDTDGTQDLFNIAEKFGVTLSRIPSRMSLKSGISEMDEIESVPIEDLLGRTQTILNRKNIKSMIEGKRVLITGAGGSIGSELVRQICELNPSKLILADISENLLYEITQYLIEKKAKIKHKSYILDIRDKRKVEKIFKETSPEITFHAAALKHVPIVEMNPGEGLLTNVIGTRNIADACERNQVKVMVQISTDKAVNPTNIMGGSKRLSECYCQALDVNRKTNPNATQFVTVRFGNVLGSAGSVIPLFQRQLQEGGPLTITDPEMTRYFMTAKEAVQLVLQASAYGSGKQKLAHGTIFALDMGKPVKIIDLANQMIRLAGFVPKKQIKIKTIGVRPGEKIHEEVFHKNEKRIETDHKDVFAVAQEIPQFSEISSAINKIENFLVKGDEKNAIAVLKEVIPQYSKENNIIDLETKVKQST